MAEAGNRGPATEIGLFSELSGEGSREKGVTAAEEDEDSDEGGGDGGNNAIFFAVGFEVGDFAALI